jgi:undecaprenyl diphosphate synthase
VARIAEVRLPPGSVPGEPEPTPVPEGIDADRVPVHVAWALSRDDRVGQPGGDQPGGAGPSAGEAGRAALLEVVDGALALGVSWLTVYARSADDRAGSSGDAGRWPAWCEAFVADGPATLGARGVRLRVAGRRAAERAANGGPTDLDELVERTAGGDRLTLTLAVDYDGRAEIVDAVAALAAAGTRPRHVDETAIARHLYHPDMPDPDLVVRTSGERRVSDLLLWEVAYSELVVVDVAWPAVRRRDFYDAVVEYQRRDRRYGGLDPMADDGGPR